MKCFLLGDAGFALTDNVMTPFRSTRYHLKVGNGGLCRVTEKEWQRGDKRPQDEKELYNLRHSSLRIVIECVFGHLKGKFGILRKGIWATYEQMQSIIWLCLLMYVT